MLGKWPIRQMFKIIITTLAILMMAPNGKALEPQSGAQLACELERAVLFGGDSDYPNGPAYFGARKDLGESHNASNKSSDPEIELQHAVDEFVTKAHGAKFLLDTRTGAIIPIPFGNEGFRAIEPLPTKRQFSRILSSGPPNDQNRNYSVGYFDSKYQDLMGVLMVDPQQIGKRIFRYTSFGTTIFGFCFTSD